MYQQSPRHKVFVSYHHEQDQKYKDCFVEMMQDDMVDRSVKIGDIDSDNTKTDEVRRQIRDDFISDAKVTVVLIGRCTWRRKHVDWEIGASLIDRASNDRCGLLGIILPSHSNYGEQTYNRYLIPPRLADNCGGNAPFAQIYDWTENPTSIRQWIHTAFLRRNETPYPHNSRTQFGRDRNNRACARGWTD